MARRYADHSALLCDSDGLIFGYLRSTPTSTAPRRSSATSTRAQKTARKRASTSLTYRPAYQERTSTSRSPPCSSSTARLASRSPTSLPRESACRVCCFPAKHSLQDMCHRGWCAYRCLACGQPLVRHFPCTKAEASRRRWWRVERLSRERKTDVNPLLYSSLFLWCTCAIRCDVRI
jgi:hypothetical protein